MNPLIAGSLIKQHFVIFSEFHDRYSVIALVILFRLFDESSCLTQKSDELSGLKSLNAK